MPILRKLSSVFVVDVFICLLAVSFAFPFLLYPQTVICIVSPNAGATPLCVCIGK